MISYGQARDIILNAGKTYALEGEIVSLTESVGRICSQEIVAPLSIQPFDNSAMDGFAVRWCDIVDSEKQPIKLEKIGLIAAGDTITNQVVQPGTCFQIMTGATIPLGADLVVPIEFTTHQNDNVWITGQHAPQANIRFAGEDFRKGSMVLQSGDYLSPIHILPLATLGIDKIKVFRKPKVAFLTTGKELADLSSTLHPGQIYNANGPYASAVLKTMGVDCVYSATISDDPDVFAKTIQELMDKDIDIIISSGAVSVGAFDFIRASLEQINTDILFHRVKIKPGKPNLFGRLPNGAFYFGLPGNPVSTAVGLRFFVAPLLRAMFHMPKEKPFYAKLARDFSKNNNLRMFLKGHFDANCNGVSEVSLFEGQASFMVSPFLSMNCWAVISEEKENLDKGEIVEWHPLSMFSCF